MSPEEIKQLRKDLNLSARELATSIKAETEDVWSWETGERFPTKRFVTRMLALRKTGGPKPAPGAKPSATATTKPAGARPPDPGGLVRLADPELWTLVRKLVQHPTLFDTVAALAKDYADPAAPPAAQPSATGQPSPAAPPNPAAPPAAED